MEITEVGGSKAKLPSVRGGLWGGGGGGVWIFYRTTQFGKFGITVICVSSCFRYLLLKLRQCLGHHRVPSSDTKINSDLGIPFLYTLVFRVSFTGCPPKKPRSLLIWVSFSHTVTPLFWVSPSTLPRYQDHLRFGYRPLIFRLFKALR